MAKGIRICGEQMSLPIQVLNASDADFQQQLNQLTAWDEKVDPKTEQVVADIIQAVREKGDEALLNFTNQFDRRQVEAAKSLEVNLAECDKAYQSLPNAEIEALEFAAKRIRAYHEKQKQTSWQYEDETGTLLGQKITPLDSVGVYVPGGKAAYPSSVLMNTIPAKVAGVKQIVMVVPAPDGQLNPWVLAAAKIAGVDRVFSVGGAQAVAALAYGTETVPSVDKIVGPGNIYVALAKRQVFGRVGIDMIAGPSEVVIISDGNTDPDWIAMDLFAQAEHDEEAQSILITPDAKFIDSVKDSIEKLLPEQPRKDIIETALSTRGALIEVATLDQAADLANQLAPEHLELAVDNADALADKIRHAGAIFIGHYTPESMGDYCAGPNHVLPTSGTARFASPLGVYDFQKRSSLIGCTAESAAILSGAASKIARGEGLVAHACSAEMRSNNGKKES